MLKIIKMFGFHLCCLHLVLKENQSPYLVPFNEVASVLQCVRDGGRLEFQCMDPRLSAGHGFTYTWTLSVTHTHTSWRCSDSDTWKLHLCHVRAQTPQKSGRGAQLQQQQQHPLLFRFSLGCTCLPFLSVYSFESQPSRSSFSLLSPLFSYPSLLSSASLLLFVPPLSLLLVLHLTERQTETDAFVGDTICVCVYVCMCVCACTASTNWLICDMRTTAASYRWGRDKRGTSDRERQRERKKRVGEMERNEKRRGKREKRENKVLVGEKGKSGWFSGGWIKPTRDFGLMRPLLNIDHTAKGTWTPNITPICEPPL